MRFAIHQFSDATVNGDGDVTAGTELTGEIRGEAASNVSFAIDTVHYTRASVAGVIPVSRCAIVDSNETNCTDAGTMRLSATWTGIGPIPHLPGTDVFWWDGCLQVDRSSTVEREATMAISLSLNGHPWLPPRRTGSRASAGETIGSSSPVQPDDLRARYRVSAKFPLGPPSLTALAATIFPSRHEGAIAQRFMCVRSDRPASGRERFDEGQEIVA